MKAIDQQLINFLVENYGVETLLLEGFSAREKKMKIVKLILSGIISGSLLTSVLSSDYFSPREKTKIEQILDNISNTEEKVPKSPEDTIPNFKAKVRAVEDYMLKSITANGFPKEAVQLKPETIVIDAAKYNFDIPLALAQAHQESCHGMTKRARKTGSVYSVGSYDNGQNVCTYDDQNKSVASYMELINKNYLQNGKKTVEDLLKPGGFVNYANKRYASDPKYEAKIRSLRNKILRDYPVLAQNDNDNNEKETYYFN